MNTEGRSSHTCSRLILDGQGVRADHGVLLFATGNRISLGNRGRLDVRIVDGGPFARTRLLGAALTGVLTRSPVYEAAEVRRLRIKVPGEGVHLACDGEVEAAPRELVIDKVRGGLAVYRGRR